MTIQFKPAVREHVGLWINLIGGTGSGKTFTAMRLASGIAGDKPFALIDTENRRGLHYADQFNFHHAELTPPFRPEAYAEAVVAADKAGYPVIVIDSGSHVWAGEGGVLDWQEEEVTRMAGDDWKRREAVKMAAWIKPKMSHKKFVQQLLQVKAHIILCLRAEEKVEMAKENGKTVIRAKHSLTGKDGWIPICDKNLPFEATCSFLLMADNPGFPHPIKLQEQHKAIFPLKELINEEAGKRLAAWAAGGSDEIEAKRTAMVDYFDKLGVSADRLCVAVKKPEIAAIGAVEVATLKGIAQEVKAGQPLTKFFPETNGNGNGHHVADEPADFVDPAIFGQPTETDESGPESDDALLEKLIANAKIRLRDITGGKARETGEILAGRNLERFDIKQAKGFHVELDKIEAAKT